MKEGCLACDVTAGRTVPPGGTIHQEGGRLLEHAISPVLLKGWLILKPERHVEHLAALNEREARALGPLIEKVSRAMMKALDPDRVYVCSFGEVVKHVHFYFLPRYPNMPPAGPSILVRWGLKTARGRVTTKQPPTRPHVSEQNFFEDLTQYRICLSPPTVAAYDEPRGARLSFASRPP